MLVKTQNYVISVYRFNVMSVKTQNYLISVYRCNMLVKAQNYVISVATLASGRSHESRKKIGTHTLSKKKPAQDAWTQNDQAF